MGDARIGLIGLGTMGAALASNIAEKGFPIAVFNRTTQSEDEETPFRNRRLLRLIGPGRNGELRPPSAGDSRAACRSTPPMTPTAPRRSCPPREAPCAQDHQHRRPIRWPAAGDGLMRARRTWTSRLATGSPRCPRISAVRSAPEAPRSRLRRGLRRHLRKGWDGSGAGSERAGREGSRPRRTSRSRRRPGGDVLGGSRPYEWDRSRSTGDRRRRGVRRATSPGAAGGV